MVIPYSPLKVKLANFRRVAMTLIAFGSDKTLTDEEYRHAAYIAGLLGHMYMLRAFGHDDEDILDRALNQYSPLKWQYGLPDGELQDPTVNTGQNRIVLEPEVVEILRHRYMLGKTTVQNLLREMPSYPPKKLEILGGCLD